MGPVRWDRRRRRDRSRCRDTAAATLVAPRLSWWSSGAGRRWSRTRWSSRPPSWRSSSRRWPVAVTLLAMVRNRLRDQIDEPVADLRQVAAAVLDGDLTARHRRGGPTDVDALRRRARRRGRVGPGAHPDCASTLNGALGAGMIFEALDLADDESGAHDVARQALAIVDPEQPVELLLARTARRS